MYFYPCKIVPNVHFIGNAKRNLIYRNFLNSSQRFLNLSPFSHFINHKYNNNYYINLQSGRCLYSTLVSEPTAESLSYTSPQNVISQDSGPSISRNEDLDGIIERLRSGNLKDIDEYVFESIDEQILKNLDKFSLNDLSNLLQLSLKNFYSQNLIESLVQRLRSSKPSELQVSTLALLIQNLGRIQPCDFHLESLHDFFDETCAFLLKLDSLSESHFSSIIYGFQRLHYSNREFMSQIVRRYERNRGNLNVNSLIISFSSLVKLNFLEVDFILNIYKIISKSISHMTLQTTIQLVSTISKIYESTDASSGYLHANFECKDAQKMEKLQKFNYKLMNYVLKHICSNYLNQLSIVQISLILNSMCKTNFRKATYLSNLVHSIPSLNGSNFRENDSLLEGGSLNSLKGEDLNSDSVLNSWNNLETLELSVKKNPLDLLKSSSKKRAKAGEENLYNFPLLPPCPFNKELTLKRLSAVDPSNLILICEAIFSLEFYDDYSLNIMFLIKDLISPILHELKSTHILTFLLSFVNIYFSNYQLQRFNLLPTRKGQVKKVNTSHLSMLLEDLRRGDFVENNYTLSNLIFKSSFFQKYLSTDTAGVNAFNTNNELLEEVKERLNRMEWKEELVLNSLENILRHVTYIKSSSELLRKFKLLFSLLIHDVYILNFPFYYNLSNFSSTSKLEDYDSLLEGKDDKNCEKLELNQLNRINTMPAILPENILETLYELYESDNSQTDSKEEESLLDSEETEQIPQNNQDLSEETKITFKNKVMYIDKQLPPFKIDILISST